MLHDAFSDGPPSSIKISYTSDEDRQDKYPLQPKVKRKVGRRLGNMKKENEDVLFTMCLIFALDKLIPEFYIIMYNNARARISGPGFYLIRNPPEKSEHFRYPVTYSVGHYRSHQWHPDLCH